MLLEALPPVLVLHLERFLYDAATDGIKKINKPVRFMPELAIPPGTAFSFISPYARQG
jgi:ubiquitin carboxyl-terminal hydrolase 10